MSPILLLSIALQIACAVHAVRTGRPMYWVFILLIGSYIAVAIYVFAEVLPNMGNNPGARRAVRGLRDKVDPERGKRLAGRKLDLADTLENRSALAEQSLRSGDYQRAAELYRSSLKGLYKTDPQLMLGLAKAQFALGLFQETKETLDALIAANPNFRSAEGHLLYARAIEEAGDLQAALHEFETLAPGYPGEEGRARYGMLLKRDGQLEKAREVFSEIVKRVNAGPKYYRREQREWVEIAERESSGV